MPDIREILTSPETWYGFGTALTLTSLILGSRLVKKSRDYNEANEEVVGYRNLGADAAKTTPLELKTRLESVASLENKRDNLEVEPKTAREQYESQKGVSDTFAKELTEIGRQLPDPEKKGLIKVLRARLEDLQKYEALGNREELEKKIESHEACKALGKTPEELRTALTTLEEYGKSGVSAEDIKEYKSLGSTKELKEKEEKLQKYEAVIPTIKKLEERLRDYTQLKLDKINLTREHEEALKQKDEIQGKLIKSREDIILSEGRVAELEGKETAYLSEIDRLKKSNSAPQIESTADSAPKKSDLTQNDKREEFTQKVTKGYIEGAAKLKGVTTEVYKLTPDDKDTIKRVVDKKFRPK